MPDNPRPLQHVHLFGDESSYQGKNEFMVYGTVSCERRNLEKVQDSLMFPDFRHEFHWSKADKYLNEHRAFIASIFQLIKHNRLRFRCIVVKTSHMRHQEYNQSNPDLGLEKYIYRQLLHYALDYQNAEGRFHVVLDAGREAKFPPEHMQRMLNAGFRKESKFDHEPFESVTVSASEKSRLVQAADVLAGAVAWVRNRRYLNMGKTGLRKEQLAADVARLARLPVIHKHAIANGIQRTDYRNLHYPTYRHADSHGFSMWNFDLTAEHRRELEEVSRLQLAAIPNRRTHFCELADLGYGIQLICPFCNRTVRNNQLDERFNNQTINQRYRPKCTECWNPRVAMLTPDPRDIPLLAHLKG